VSLLLAVRQAIGRQLSVRVRTQDSHCALACGGACQPAQNLKPSLRSE